MINNLNINENICKDFYFSFEKKDLTFVHKILMGFFPKEISGLIQSFFIFKLTPGTKIMTPCENGQWEPAIVIEEYNMSVEVHFLRYSSIYDNIDVKKTENQLKPLLMKYINGFPILGIGNDIFIPHQKNFNISFLTDKQQKNYSILQSFEICKKIAWITIHVFPNSEISKCLDYIFDI
jgi:hypothetical protein